MNPEDLSSSLFVWIIIAGSAVFTGVIHGATGMAGGLIMTIILTELFGIKTAIPIMTCALIFSHASRVVINWHHTDWRVSRTVLIFGLPMTALGALIFNLISPATVAAVFAGFLTLSIGIRRWAKQRQLYTGPKLLAAASAVWGLLAGNVVGPGFFLAPFLLGTGMNRLNFAGTLATATLVMNVVKLSVFGAVALLTPALLLAGVTVGLLTIPGNWIGSKILRKMTDGVHSRIVEGMTVCIILYFAVLAFYR